MSTRAFRIFAAALSGVLMFFGSAVSTAVAADPEVVRFGWFGGPRIWTICKANGMFEKGLGTKVEWVQFPSGAAALTSLAAKQVDISRLGSTPTVAGIARKLPIEVFAIDGIIQTSERLIAKNPITSVAQLKGKRIAYPPGSTAHYALMAALKVNNIAPKEVTLISLTPADMVAAWKRGDIDAGYVWGPFSHTMEGDGGKEVLATQALQKNGYYVWNDYVVRKEFAEKYPDIVVKWLQTYQQCVEMYNKDREAMVKLVAQHLNQNEAAVRDTMGGLFFPSIKETITLLGEGGPIQPAMLDTARFLVELGDLKQSEVPASFKPAVNVSYLERAVK